MRVSLDELGCEGLAWRTPAESPSVHVYSVAGALSMCNIPGYTQHTHNHMHTTFTYTRTALTDTYLLTHAHENGLNTHIYKVESRRKLAEEVMFARIPHA